jgi:hypothetical protein
MDNVRLAQEIATLRQRIADLESRERLVVGNANPAALGAAAPGIDTEASREDHVHPLPSAGDVGAEPALGNPAVDGYVLSSSTAGVRVWVPQTAATPLSNTNPLALGTAAPGIGTAASRDDHIHPMPTAADVGATATGTGGAAGRVAVWDGANSIGGSANFTYGEPGGAELTITAPAAAPVAPGTTWETVIGGANTPAELRLTRAGAGVSVIDLVPQPSDGTSGAFFRFFRFTNTAGSTNFDVHAGDGTSTINARIAGKGVDSYVCRTSGDFGVGTPTPAHRLDVAGGDANVRSGFVYRVNGTQVVAARRTGWAAATGTATRTTFATSTVTTAQLAERVKALIDDLIAHGLLGA